MRLKTLKKKEHRKDANLNCKHSIKGRTIRTGAHRGRNTICPCGSELKFKKCCIDK